MQIKGRLQIIRCVLLERAGFLLEIAGGSSIIKSILKRANGGILMHWKVVLLMVLGAIFTAGCAGPPEKGVLPREARYERWGEKMGQIPQIVMAGKLTEAALEHHRNANKMRDHYDIYAEFSMAIALFELAARQLYIAWEYNPEYKDYILWELDKVYGYRHSCISRRPFYFDPIDPLNVMGGVMTHQQRQRVRQYRQQLSRWEKAAGQ